MNNFERRLIAVNYEARAHGVTRGMRVSEAKAKCKDVHLFKVPEQRGKADLTKYRNASAEVFNVICSFDEKIVVERASIDEAFLDLTGYVKSVDVATLDEIDITDLAVEGFQATDGETAIDAFQKFIAGDANSQSRTVNEHLITAAQVVKEIRARIKSNTQFTCTAGVSHNKGEQCDR